MIDNRFLVKDNIQNIYPLTPMQEGMYFHAQDDTSSTAYFEQIVYELSGHLDVSLLRQSLSALFHRYDILRTVFVQKSHDKPLQVVLKQLEPDFRHVDAGSIENRNEFLAELQHQDRLETFSLSKDVLMRLTVIQWNSDEFALIWSYHHILLDGWCTNVLITEFYHIYDCLRNSKPITLPAVKPFYLFVRWLEKLNTDKAREYWIHYLDNFEQCSVIPRKKIASANKEYLHAKQQFQLDAKAAQRISTFIADRGITLNTFIQAVWGILLAKWNNTNDAVFGAVVSGRPAEVEGVETMIGLFINTIPVRITFNEETSFNDVLTDLHRHGIEGLPYHHYPLADIQSNTAPGRKLIDHILVFGNYPRALEHIDTGKHAAHESISLTVNRMDNFEQTNYDFNVSVTVTNAIWIDFTFNANVIDTRLVERMVQQLRYLIDQVVENPNEIIRKIRIVSPIEQDMMLRVSSGSALGFSDQSVVSLFTSQATNQPEAPAIICDTRILSYGDLHDKSNRLANYLLQKEGVKQGDCIALLCERNEWLPVCLLAVLKAGCCYVAIDVELPHVRQIHLLNDTKSKLVISSHQQAMGWFTDNRMLNIVEQWPTITHYHTPHEEYQPATAAYIIYSSGSTGSPKGVVISNTSLSHYVQSFSHYFSITSSDIFACQSSVSFDTLVEEIYPALCNGGRVVMVPAGGRDAYQLAQIIQRETVTVISTPPLVINELNKHYPSCFNTLRHVISGGDLLRNSYIEKIPAHVSIYNTYGPSETTVCASYARVEERTECEIIGSPISNHRIYILDTDQSIQPLGVLGELFISGPGVGLGYLNNPELTARHFLEDPFVPGHRMFRTGDLGRWTENGQLEFAGRKDNQVKVRGYRVELGEIESIIRQGQAVNEVVVLLQETFLVAYYTGDSHETYLREYVKERLPAYMIPAQWVHLDEFPLTITGKIDRKLIPIPATQSTRHDPETDTEKILLDLWREVLDKQHIGVMDDFFVNGGHSLKATRLLVQIYRKFSVELKLSDIFNHSNIEALSKRIDRVLTQLEVVS